MVQLRVLLLSSVALLAAPGVASATGTVSRDGSQLVYRGTDATDKVFIEYLVPPYALEPSYSFGNTRDNDPVTAGPGCTQTPWSATCPVGGIDHIEVLMGSGNDLVNGGTGTAIAASITVRGGPGNDSVFGDEKPPSGTQELYGDDGDDQITAFSLNVPARMEGGAGDDHFIWEQTARGVPTFADGGPGDDRFDAETAFGPDTIVGGGGADTIDVFNRGRPSDADTVTCAPEGIAFIHADKKIDHVDGSCHLDAFAKSLPAIKKAFLRLVRSGLATSRVMRLPALGVPRAGSVRLRLTAYPRRKGVVGERRIPVHGTGKVSLKLRLSARMRASLVKGALVVLRVTYKPITGRSRVLNVVGSIGR